MIWLALAGLLILACWVYLAVLPLGLGIQGEVGPHPVKGRVVAGSPFGAVVRRFRGKDGADPASGILVFGWAHFAGHDAGPYLICHELGHMVRSMRVGRYRHTVRSVCDREFAEADEAWAHEFALAYQSDGLVRVLFERMAAAEQARLGQAVKVAGGGSR